MKAERCHTNKKKRKTLYAGSFQILFALSILLVCTCFTACSTQNETSAPIDRYALVSRHNPVIRVPDPLSPLSVGNGEFAFTVDITGLQTFPDFHVDDIPLQTQSHWGWHSFPNPGGYRLEDTYELYETYGRKVAYPTKLSAAASPWAASDSTDSDFQPFAMSKEEKTAAHWLRANPHRIDLGRIGLILRKSDGSIATIDDLAATEQELDLWTGWIVSRFELEGVPVEVHTLCHPNDDMIAARVVSPLIKSGRIGISIRFPYATGSYGKTAADWDNQDSHDTTVLLHNDSRIDLKRTLDEDIHYVSIASQSGAELSQTGKHEFQLIPDSAKDSFEFTSVFSPEPPATDIPGFASSSEACGAHWETFWSTGGAIDLSGSTDSRANELERRIILSQYLTAIQCAGSLPPQETGLTLNSWHGKFHLEMHWTHCVHFALWGRIGLMENSLPYYSTILPAAQNIAKEQGYSGARWPKMVGPAGRQSPSYISPLIVWQQPHPIYFAELCYREHGDRGTLENYKEIVFESAEFMASFFNRDKSGDGGNSGHYVLGPPLIPYQESLGAKTKNPVFELAYWAWGLETAQTWRERLGLPRSDEWDRVLSNLPPLTIKSGRYVAAQSTSDTFENPGHQNDHPSFLCAFGMLPGLPYDIDREAMRGSLHGVLDMWNWESTWGSDPSLVAMTAVRLNEPETAIDILLRGKPLKNRFLPNGHCFQNNEILPVFLPANGGLLTTVAMMAAGWDGAPDVHAPGFPGDGSWDVRWEGLRRLP